MRFSVKPALTGLLCGAAMMTALPAEVLAGPTSVADPSSVALSAPTQTVHYRRYRAYRHYGYYHRRHYYRRYGYYDLSGAAFAGVAAGLLGAGVIAATRPHYYGGYYPYYGGWGYGYGYPYYGGGWGGWGW